MKKTFPSAVKFLFGIAAPFIALLLVYLIDKTDIFVLFADVFLALSLLLLVRIEKHEHMEPWMIVIVASGVLIWGYGALVNIWLAIMIIPMCLILFIGMIWLFIRDYPDIEDPTYNLQAN